ncbi:MAG TPA: hypothetical protein PLH98_10375 [Ruminococcus flavefaciens]|mgnify:CR=1 FL=1|nr:hypothetical protein [Ruminococcus flavefaciens]HQM00941.1 hypothetical protein [Ruminococcus flavefaciens]
MDEHRSDAPEYPGEKRRRTPTSAAQKLLILLMLAALAVLIGIIVWVARYPKTTDVIDLLNRHDPPVRFTQPITSGTVTETTAETTAAETTSAETDTTSAETEKTTEETTAPPPDGGYKIGFSIAIPQYISGNYILTFTYKDTGETTEIPAFSIPDTVSADVELAYPQASTYVAADVYLKNTANGKQAFAGILNLDFANGLCDQSGIELYSAIDAVQ